MARKSSKPAECMFIGNSDDLKHYLTTKKKFFKELLKKEEDVLNPKQIKKLKSFIDSIEDMLAQKYFTGDRVYTMAEMVEDIKLERADLKSAMDAIEAEVEEARSCADAAFKKADNYLANKYEEKLYNSAKQKKLRELIDEYQAVKFEHDTYDTTQRALWWLLGVIHRPTGFFSKVLDA